MTRITPASFLGLFACLLALPAAAVPVHATFNGQVSGGAAFSAEVLNQFPVSTSASFDVTFDDTNLQADAQPTAYGVGPVSGTVTLGALEWVLDAGSIVSYSFFQNPFSIANYQLQLTGSGPSIANNAGSIFGLFMRIAPDLDPISNGAAFLMGFRFPVESGEYYGYAELSGTYSATRGNITVPEPSTALLMLGALMLLLGWRGKRWMPVAARAATVTRFS